MFFFRQFFKLTFVTFIWKRYKHTILSTIFLFFYMWLVGRVHHDFLSYVELHEHSGRLGGSFILKWIALLAGVASYFGFHWVRRKNLPEKEKSPIRSPFKKSKKIPEPDPKDPEDPFREIRSSKSLKSEADLVIARNLSRKNSPQDKR